MSRIAPVVRREFRETVTSRAYFIGTALGPLLIIGLFALEFIVFAKGGGGNHRITILDASPEQLGPRIRTALENPPPMPAFIARPVFQITVEPVAAAERGAATVRLQASVSGQQLDGFLWLPPDVIAGGTAEYEGSNATNTGAITTVKDALQRTVQSERLRRQGIDEVQLGRAMTPVKFESYKSGERGVTGNPAAAKVLAFLMSFAIYVVVLMYGQSIMSAVQEEKRDRVVELIVSSIRARDLLLGKVIGIGAAGVLQMSIWAAVAGLLLSQGGAIAAQFGADPGLVQILSQQKILPAVPASAGIIFVACFAGGFFLFATLYAVIGAIVTNAQEAQQFVFPVMLPFIAGLFIAMAAGENPNSAMAVVGSYIPFTSPMVLPVRAVTAGVGVVEGLVSLVLLFGTAFLIIGLAAKIYRIAIFATGKKPTWAELARWVRAD
ncbi:MAG: ABC transporter permease [Gemmatimonadetes bacterium]|nr:ABC transporter permease [Gemmatimonadota bacterium]